LVYKAVQLATRRDVAVKVLLAGRLAGPQQRSRFEREIEVVAALRHPFLVTVYDSGVTPDALPYFVMEYVDGQPLQAYAEALRSERDEGLRRLLAVFLEACDGMTHAHQHGVIHRDLKPSNILIDQEGHPHIVDFGLAKLASGEGDLRSAITLGGEFLGTLAYAAPEQVSEDAAMVDVRTDVHALGVILYELLARQPPYPTSGSLSDAVHAINHVVPARPCSLLSIGLPASLESDLDVITLKCLSKDPQERYQTASSLAADVRRALSGEPIEARRASTWYVVSRTVRRHWLKATAAAGALALLLVFAVAMSLMYRRSALEAAKANQIRIFLEDTLGSVEPPQPGQDVTMHRVLDEAVHWVEISLRGQPEVEASLRQTIGNSYRALGRYDVAEQQLTRALELNRELFGESHRAVAQSISLLGHVYRNRGDSAKAEEAFRRALGMRRELLGFNHPDVSTSLQNLASVLTQREDFAEAELLLRESLSIRVNHFSTEHQDVAMASFKLAELLAARGELDEAEQFHTEALASRLRLLHGDHPDIAASLLALGDLLAKAGRNPEAEPFLARGLEIQRRILQPDDWRIAQTEGLLGETMLALDRFAEAEILLRKSYSGLTARLGPSNPHVRLAIERLIRFYDRCGRDAEAAWARELGQDADAATKFGSGSPGDER
jgi:tetratricopeptide (TPR) repeat protein/predicted Ser/Thr protein kinase